MVYNFLIINSSGSMIYSYQKDDVLKTNQLLILCGTLHSVKSMVNKLSDKENVLYFKYSKTIISIFVSAMDISFVFISDKKETEIYSRVHKEYCDYVMLDPFYIIDMPINSRKFNPTKYF